MEEKILSTDDADYTDVSTLPLPFGERDGVRGIHHEA